MHADKQHFLSQVEAAYLQHEAGVLQRALSRREWSSWVGAVRRAEAACRPLLNEVSRRGPVTKPAEAELWVQVCCVHVDSCSSILVGVETCLISAGI